MLDDNDREDLDNAGGVNSGGVNPGGANPGGLSGGLGGSMGGPVGGMAGSPTAGAAPGSTAGPVQAGQDDTQSVAMGGVSPGLGVSPSAGPVSGPTIGAGLSAPMGPPAGPTGPPAGSYGPTGTLGYGGYNYADPVGPPGAGLSAPMGPPAGPVGSMPGNMMGPSTGPAGPVLGGSVFGAGPGLAQREQMPHGIPGPTNAFPGVTIGGYANVAQHPGIFQGLAPQQAGLNSGLVPNIGANVPMNVSGLRPSGNVSWGTQPGEVDTSQVPLGGNFLNMSTPITGPPQPSLFGPSPNAINAHYAQMRGYPPGDGDLLTGGAPRLSSPMTGPAGPLFGGNPTIGGTPAYSPGLDLVQDPRTSITPTLPGTAATQDILQNNYGVNRAAMGNFGVPSQSSPSARMATLGQQILNQANANVLSSLPAQTAVPNPNQVLRGVGPTTPGYPSTLAGATYTGPKQYTDRIKATEETNLMEKGAFGGYPPTSLAGLPRGFARNPYDTQYASPSGIARNPYDTGYASPQTVAPGYGIQNIDRASKAVPNLPSLPSAQLGPLLAPGVGIQNVSQAPKAAFGAGGPTFAGVPSPTLQQAPSLPAMPSMPSFAQPAPSFPAVPSMPSPTLQQAPSLPAAPASGPLDLRQAAYDQAVAASRIARNPYDTQYTPQQFTQPTPALPAVPGSPQVYRDYTNPVPQAPGGVASPSGPATSFAGLPSSIARNPYDTMRGSTQLAGQRGGQRDWWVPPPGLMGGGTFGKGGGGLLDTSDKKKVHQGTGDPSSVNYRPPKKDGKGGDGKGADSMDVGKDGRFAINRRMQNSFDEEMRRINPYWSREQMLIDKGLQGYFGSQNGGKGGDGKGGDGKDKGKGGLYGQSKHPYIPMYGGKPGMEKFSYGGLPLDMLRHPNMWGLDPAFARQMLRQRSA